MPRNSNTQIDSDFAAAKSMWERDDPAKAEAMLRAINAQVPAREDVAMLLARVLQSQGRLGAACETLRAACEAAGFDAGMSLRCATFAQQCDRHVIAMGICEGAIARGGVSPDVWMLAGNVAREMGDFALARARYGTALDTGVDLDRQHVFGALANTRRYADPADPEIASFARHFADTRYSPHSRASAGFALAKAQNDLEDYAAAATTLRAANGMLRAIAAWDADAWCGFVAARQAERVAFRAASVDHGFVPVFIVGVPRSGTTLAATLLARTTGARDRGELRTLRFVAGQLVAGGHLGNAAALAEAAGLYRRLAIQDDAPAKHYLDQDPLNFRYLHVAAAMFPQARVIHLRRDRRDTALSLWSQDFAHPDLAFAYDFGDIAAYMDGHDALLRHWTRNLSLPIFELDYETLVTATEASLAKLRDFIGARACVPAVEEAAAPVQSASVWQARQPVYKTSVGRWQHYAPYVPELARFGP